MNSVFLQLPLYLHFPSAGCDNWSHCQIWHPWNRGFSELWGPQWYDTDC